MDRKKHGKDVDGLIMFHGRHYGVAIHVSLVPSGGRDHIFVFGSGMAQMLGIGRATRYMVKIDDLVVNQDVVYRWMQIQD